MEKIRKFNLSNLQDSLAPTKKMHSEILQKARETIKINRL